MADTEIVDVSLLDKVSIRLVALQKGGEVQELQHSTPIPEEIMGILDPYLGDGRATVTVGAEVASSIEFGFKAQAFVSMTVTCDNSLEKMEAVRDILLQHVGSTVEPAHAHIAAVRDKILADSKGQPAEAPKVTSGPPAKAMPAPRPSFRR